MTESKPQNRRLGYARVSTYGQTLDAQLAQLRAEGCAPIDREKPSGAQPTRRELLKLLKALAPGDVVTVTRIDRLARSTFDLFAIVKQIVDTGGQFRSLAEPWADTATRTGRLMIAVLGGLADAGNVAEVLGQAAVYSVTTGILLWACQRLRPVREQKTAFYALWVCLCAIVAGGVPLNQMSQRGWMANDQSLFMESAGASCIKKQQSVQANGSISNDKISRYCTCFAR